LGQGDVVEVYAHCTRRRIQGVAEPIQIGPHCGVRLVHPRREALDARRGIGSLHRRDRIGPRPEMEFATENRIVIDLALVFARKDRGGDTRRALH
jgi:hypothetical protein